MDTSADGQRRTFYLSVCSPLPYYIPGCHGELKALEPSSTCLPSHPPALNNYPALPGSAVGSCLVSEEKSWNLGVVQISPQAAENGSLSIVYVNGDKCENQRFSTRITLECAHTAVRVRQARRAPPVASHAASAGAFCLTPSVPVFSWVLGHQ